MSVSFVPHTLEEVLGLIVYCAKHSIIVAVVLTDYLLNMLIRHDLDLRAQSGK